ncbi:MAG TPA: OmpH family outer membrane protein [Candidatus Aquilonibacter sp.]|nr:OmpH family outer membrane protein [Candidatus Aquilonibacter sp.]
MTSKSIRPLLGIAAFFAISACAQTSSAATPSSPSALPSAPSATAAGTKVGTINIEQAVVGTNEGRRDFEALDKKLEPKKNELKAQNDELESLQKQLQTQGDKLNEDARTTLVNQIQDKKKAFDRAVQDAQDDAQTQQKEIFQRILQKMAPVIVKYAQDNGLGVIVDISNPWPQSPILWAGPGVDITKPVVDIYNAQSGVPAPASGGVEPRPTTSRPSTGARTAPKTTQPSK